MSVKLLLAGGFSLWLVSLQHQAPERHPHDLIKAKVTKPVFRYRPQFAVVVICEDEAQQRRRFETLQKKGWPLRVVSV